MGRRALGKFDLSLDLSRHLLAWDDLPQPCDQAAIFGEIRPLEIEVGTGKGLFLSGAAATHLDRHYLGIEVANKYAQFAAAKLAKRDLHNARLVHTDAMRVFREWLPDDFLAAVHVYFPDPWWKKRHRKRRVMTPVFVADVQRTLKTGGTLHFWTDVEEYFHESMEVLAGQHLLEGPIDVPPQAAQHDLDYRTHFERRMRLNGMPVYRAEFRRR